MRHVGHNPLRASSIIYMSIICLSILLSALPLPHTHALTFALFAPADTSSAFILVRVFFEV